MSQTLRQGYDLIPVRDAKPDDIHAAAWMFGAELEPIAPLRPYKRFSNAAGFGVNTAPQVTPNAAVKVVDHVVTVYQSDGRPNQVDSSGAVAMGKQASRAE